MPHVTIIRSHAENAFYGMNGPIIPRARKGGPSALQSADMSWRSPFPFCFVPDVESSLVHFFNYRPNQHCQPHLAFEIGGKRRSLRFDMWPQLCIDDRPILYTCETAQASRTRVGGKRRKLSGKSNVRSVLSDVTANTGWHLTTRRTPRRTRQENGAPLR